MILNSGMPEAFAGYGAVNAGREYNDVEISRRTFLEQYVKPFRMALKAAYGHDSF